MITNKREIYLELYQMGENLVDNIAMNEINAEKFMVKFLKEHYYEIIDNNNNFKYEIYDVSSKCLPKETLKEILFNENPLEKIHETIFEYYNENDCVEELIYSLESEYPYIPVNLISEIRFWIQEHICIQYPVKEFLNEKYAVNVIIDTGDSNYDFTLNCAPFYCEIDDKASIVWFANENGYSKKQLENALKNEKFSKSKFLKLLYEEVYNCTSHMNALTFLIEATLEELIIMQSKSNIKYIKINKSAKAGLCDFWNGAGGLLNIQLEKDIVIPMKYIHSSLPDGLVGYGINEIYGLDRKLWERGRIIEIGE